MNIVSSPISKSFTVTVLVLLALAGGPAKAASAGGAEGPVQINGLSLSMAQAEAEDKNPDLKRLKSNSQKVSWDKTTALAGYLPHITASYDHAFAVDSLRENIVFGGEVVNFPAAAPQDNLLLDASLTVFDGLDSYYKYKAASLKADACELEYSRAKFQTQTSVAIGFYEALAAQKLLDVAKQNVLTLGQHLERAKLTLRAGYGTKFDVLRIEASLQEATADQEQAENNVLNTREALQVAMGIEGDDHRPLVGDLPVFNAADVPKNLEFEVTGRSDLRAQMKRVDSARQETLSAQSFWYPTVSVFGEESFYKFGSFDSVVEPNSSFQNASSVGVRLRWNLFDGGSSYAKEKQAAESEYEQRQLTAKALIAIPKEVAKWQRQFYYNVSLYQARLKTLAEYEESVRLAGIGIKAGSITHTEMLDAELDLFRARGGLVKAQAQMVEAFHNLQLSLGKELAVQRI